MATTIVQVPFKITSDSYETFIGDLRDKLAGSNPENVKGHRVLAKQTGNDKQPPRWIYVELEGKSGANPKVAIRSDNAYIVGFTNKDGRWFEFKNTAMLLPKEKTKMLSYDSSYRELVGDVNNLPNLKLGKYNTSDAATALWNHTQKAYVDNNLGGDLMALDLKKALATLAVTFCEAARFIPVFNVINDGWEKPAGSSITAQHVNYLTNWGKISEALLGWKNDNFKNDEKWFKNLQSIEISTGQDALGVVKLLLNKPPKPRGVLAWLRYLWGLLVKPQPEKNQKPKLEKNQQPKSSSIVNPL